MRVRLRAPDEDVGGNGSSSGSETGTATGGHGGHANPLPHFDVRSPEYIEERLENLKRRPSWRSWLDQYVKDHPEDSDEETEEDAEDTGAEAALLAIERPEYYAEVKTTKGPGFTRTVVWSVVVLLFAPLLVLLYPCLRNKGKSFWPLGCACMSQLFLTAIANVVFIFFSLLLIHWTICRELPEWSENPWTNLVPRLENMLQATETCQAAVLQMDWLLAQELCMPIGIDVTLLLLNVWLLFNSHCKWARYMLLTIAALYLFDTPARLYEAAFPAPEIHGVDPSYALIGEELMVALEGKNIKPGASIAWVAYWGCATTTPVHTCAKQFESTFGAGVVPVTFESMDHFIPCYRDPPNPLKALEFECFENVRLRVKDKQGIPGWSKIAATPSSPQDEIVAVEEQVKQSKQPPVPVQQEAPVKRRRKKEATVNADGEARIE